MYWNNEQSILIKHHSSNVASHGVPIVELNVEELN